MTQFLERASLLITGGTGSFGRRLARRLLERTQVRRLVIFSRDEFKQYEMARELAEVAGDRIRFFLGDVRDRERLELALDGIDYVVHAAALKQVPAAEYNPTECIRTNVYGAENVTLASIRAGVKKIIALSSDKAVNPINLYGASKLAADKIFVAGNSLVGSRETRFSIARYGNVLGSRGSVVGYFQSLIAQGSDSLPITDPRMTRFWITLDSGIDFVLSCLDTMVGGEIFVPKIPSMKVIDVARTLAPKLPHRIIGIRPGEKLHETLITQDDARTTLDLPDRYVIQPSLPSWDGLHLAKLGGHPVPEDFAYSSDENPEWLDPTKLREMLDE